MFKKIKFKVYDDTNREIAKFSGNTEEEIDNFYKKLKKKMF